jgi:hypothetical protein
MTDLHRAVAPLIDRLDALFDRLDAVSAAAAAGHRLVGHGLPLAYPRRARLARSGEAAAPHPLRGPAGRR